MRTHITSLEISDLFEIDHKFVLRSIRKILSDDPELFSSYFNEQTYQSKQNKPVPMFEMGCDGFQLLSSSNSMSRGKNAIAKSQVLNEFGCECYVVAQKSSRFEDSYYGLLCEFLPEFKISRQFPVAGMRVDFYLEESGIFIEYDEEQHLSPAQQKKDEERWGIISNHLADIHGAKPWLVRVSKGNEIKSLRAIAGVMSVVCVYDLFSVVDEESKIVRV